MCYNKYNKLRKEVIRMNDYKIRFTIDGLITIDANTEEEAVEKYRDLPWAEVFEKGYGFSQEAEVLEVIEEPKKNNKPLSTLEKFILDWLGYYENDDVWKRETIMERLPDLESEKLVTMIQDIIENF